MNENEDEKENYDNKMFWIKIAMAALCSVFLVYVHLPYMLNFGLFLLTGFIFPIPVFLFILKIPRQVVSLFKMSYYAFGSYFFTFFLIQITYYYFNV